MKNESAKYFYKENGKWVCDYEVSDPAEVHRRLMHVLIAKKLHKCTYIRSIKDESNFNGTRTITVYYDNGCKSVFVIEF